MYATTNVKGPVQRPSFCKHIDWNDGNEYVACPESKDTKVL